MKRRIIAALMCLCMLVGLLPMSAFAADPGTVTATKDVVSQTPDKNGNYTIKLTVQGEPVEIPSESAADVVLVVDNSGSMASSVGEPCLTPKSEFVRKWTVLWYRYTCPNCGARYSSSLLGILWDTQPDYCTGQKGAEPRINTAKKVGKTFAQTILKDGNANQLAVIGFAHNSKNGGPNDANALFVTQPLTNDLTQINNKIDKMDADGGTNYSAALQQAYKWLNNRADKTRPAYVIFISDGAPGLSGESIDDSQWNGSKQAADLKRDGVTLYTIGIALTDDESNYLESLATDSNHYINVTGTNYADKLKEVLLEWASHINSVPAGKNAVMTDVVNTEYFDVVTPLPAGVTLGSDGKTLVWNIGAIPKDGTSVEITIKPKADVLNTITGTKTVNTNTNVSLTYVDYNGANQTIPKEQIGDPTVNLIGTKPAEYTLTYNDNAQSGGMVENLPASAQYPTGPVTLSTQKPTHTPVLINPGDEKATDVLFIGWTEEPTTKIYAEGDGAPTTVATVTMTEAGKTVYAAWGYDANGNDKPDVTEDGYLLTYDGNAQGGTVDKIPVDNTQYLVNADVTLITKPNPKPTHTAVLANPEDAEATAVVFIGWTETQTTQIFKKGDAAPTTTDSVKMVEGGKIVYAAWGYDVNDDGNPDVNENGYKLTYQENNLGGTVGNMPTDNNTYLIGVTVPLSGQVPTYTAADGTTKVLFVGWTETENTKIYGKNDTAPTTVTSVTMAEGGKTVYAAWGYDANGNGTPDYKEETEDAYFYVLKPSVTDATGTAPQNFFYVGQGSIFDETNDVTDFTGNGVQEYISELPDDDLTGIGAGAIANNVGKNFSNVLWYRVKTANGANSNNPEDPVVGSDTSTRHVDGLLKPEDGKYGMIFMYDGGAVYYVTIDVNSTISADAMAAANNAALTAADKTADQWNVVWKNADGSVADVASATGEAGQLLFFYADFAEKTATYTLSYDANAQQGGTVDNMPSNPTTRYSSGHVETLDSRVPSHSDVNGQKVVFIGWSKTKSNKIYSASEGYGDIVSKVTFANANITVYAVWGYDSNDDDGHHSKYTLYYHSNFGEDVTFYQSSSTRSVTVKEYENVGRLPERDGYVFVSWNTEPDGSGERYMPGDPFHIKGSSDHLYAQWQKDKTGPDDSGVSNWLETDEHRAYLTGYPDSTFRADRNMTRAEVAQMFYALLLDKNVTITKSFSDVPDDAWYATAVKTLASLGMMDGYPDGTFRPDEPITRAEFATVGLAFAYDPLDASCSYYDVGASAWYHTYVAQATTYGWIGGYPDNTFRPGNNITRVEVCVIVNNMLGRDADERYIDRNEDELVHFVDLSDSYWGYYTIMESTNTHEYTGSFTNEKWTDVK